MLFGTFGSGRANSLVDGSFSWLIRLNRPPKTLRVLACLACLARENGVCLGLPFENAIDGWILGSQRFADRVRQLISPNNQQPSPKVARCQQPLTQRELLRAICDTFAISELELSRQRNRHPARALFAYLAHRHTNATLSDLAKQLGLSRADSVPAQIQRVTQASGDSPLRQELERLVSVLKLNCDS